MSVFRGSELWPEAATVPGVETDPKPPEPTAPRLPQRAAIYIAPDGTVHFGALFKDLVPVADALGRPAPPDREK
jgi:hypothetical protein